MTETLDREALRAGLFDQIPSGIVVLERDLRIVDHNAAFAEMFGGAVGSHCYAALKGRNTVCPGCPAESTFADGRERVREQSGRDRMGLPVHYFVQVVPVPNGDGGPRYVTAITTDVTATKRLQREYQTLFEKVPCYVAVINTDYRVVKANERFRRTFGEPTGEHCYTLFKRRKERCGDCVVERTFRDGQGHTSPHVGMALDGTVTHYLAVTAPLLQGDGEVTHAIQMSLDITDVHELTEQLNRANEMRRMLVESSPDGIVVLDPDGRVALVNAAAEKLWGWSRSELQGHRPPKGSIPRELRPVLAGRQESRLLMDSAITRSDGERLPVRAGAVGLRLAGDFLGAAVLVQDLREMKQLEREKLDAERLAAVGQTVAGLAHGIKNILTGLEGGMYVMSSGMKRSDEGRLRQGFEMLERNMHRISDLAKNLLAFSRGERLEPQLVDPARVVSDVVTLYRDAAEQQGILLTEEIEQVEPAWLDPEALHSGIVNLVSNAVDACLVSQHDGCRIAVRLFEEERALVIEVHDTGCGMDYEVKQKAFTSFFTTKGSGGTGLGLLITRKIVQQHGGSIALHSSPGAGTTFRLEFPRDRLPRPAAKEDEP